MLTINVKSKDLEDYCIKNSIKYERVDHFTIFVELNNTFLPFFTLNGPSCSEPLRRIIEYKHLTLKYLSRYGLSISPYTLFDKNNPRKLFEFAESNYPLVLKPINENKGNGLIFGIENDKDLTWALKLFNSKSGWGIAEKHFEGDDYRAFVVMDEVIVLSKRDAANVVGDGIHTISELIDIKNKYRLTRGDYYKSRLIPQKLDNLERLQDQKLSLEHVPRKNQKIYLKYARNVSQGGDSVDCTSKMSSKLKEILINSRKAIPSLKYTAIDIMINGDLEGDFSYIINELNFQFASLSMYHTYGERVDMIAPIIDYYRKYYPNNI